VHVSRSRGAEPRRWFLPLLCLALAGGRPAVAQECPDRHGNLPVIATTFRVGGALRAKLRVPEDFERTAAAKLASELQCVNEVRFLDWKPRATAGAASGGTLQAAMERKGELPNVWIEIRLSFSLGGAPPAELTRLPARFAVLYPPKEPQAPGIEGVNWLTWLEKRFSELAGDPGFRAVLAERFRAVPLTTKDVREDANLQRIVLPFSRNDLEAAEEGTVLTLAVQPKSGRLLQELTLSPACAVGVSFLLGRVFPTPWSEVSRILGDRKATALWLKSYRWSYPGTCSRFEGSRR
jgi:hypothetical protein